MDTVEYIFLHSSEQDTPATHSLEPMSTNPTSHRPSLSATLTSRSSDERASTASLDDVRIGTHTAGEVVKHLEKLFGCELTAQALQQGASTRIWIENNKKTGGEANSSGSLYDITDGGYFHTNDARHSISHHRVADEKFFAFSKVYEVAPKVIAGLAEYETDLGTNYAMVFCICRDIHEHIFKLFVGFGSAIKPPSAAYVWFSIPSDNPLLQTGNFCTDDAGNRKTYPVRFTWSYKSPPKIVIWLASIRFLGCHNIEAHASDITTTGFTAHINTWGATSNEGSAGISWFAYPSDMPDIRSGNVTAEEQTDKGMVKFEKPFKRVPRRVLVALNKLESVEGKPIRFKVIHEAVSTHGMGVRIESWGNTRLASAGAAYIAIE